MRVLADSSIWIQHLHRGLAPMRALLAEGRIAIHVFVRGEVALGRLHNRAEILASLHTLPPATIAAHEEVLSLIEHQDLAGSGIGWVDAHLLASALIDHTRLWTLDRRLARIATEAGAAWTG
ncbi:MAG: PIN domain-containing protein [Gemmatimonadota bacterium]